MIIDSNEAMGNNRLTKHFKKYHNVNQEGT